MPHSKVRGWQNTASLVVALVGLDIATKLGASSLPAPDSSTFALVYLPVPYPSLLRFVGGLTVVAGALPFTRTSEERVFLALGLAGGLGNFSELLTTGFVTDWIMLQVMGVRLIFNLADTWLALALPVYVLMRTLARRRAPTLRRPR